MDGTGLELGMLGPKVLHEVARHAASSVPRNRRGGAKGIRPTHRWRVTACLGRHPVRSGAMEHWEWTCAADVDGGAIFETTHERSPATLRFGGVDDALHAGSAGDAQRTMASAVETGSDAHESAHAAAGERNRPRSVARPAAACAGTPPAGPRVGLAVTSVAVGHLPTGCSPGSTACLQAALVD